MPKEKAKAGRPKKKISKKTKSADKPVKEKKEKYFESIGRRKTAVARVRLFSHSSGEFLINDKQLKEYFSQKELQQTVLSPLVLTDCLNQFKVSARLKGGGTVSQSEAVRHGLARALVLFNADFRKKLKKAGFLKRDQRMRERKKFGLKRARRAPQWRKR